MVAQSTAEPQEADMFERERLQDAGAAQRHEDLRDFARDLLGVASKAGRLGLTHTANRIGSEFDELVERHELGDI